MLGLYQSWSLHGCPFETRALPPNADGERLLVGRSTELDQIARRLLTPNKMVTLEGANGIGKTSVNNVAAYRLYSMFLSGDSAQLIIPCDKVFQLRADSKLDDFIEHVFYHVALTLIKYNGVLTDAGHNIQLDKLSEWLQSPILNSNSKSVSVQGIGGIGSSKGEATNNSSGFAKGGFVDLVKSLLNQIFPNNDGGGVVCSIDNLELLRESEAARTAVEALRDELLTVNGLRWILCGSTGIVRTLAATPRLQGFLHTPIELKEIDPTLAQQILISRFDAYRLNEHSYLPIIPENFANIYEILRGNLRDTLSTADDFCNWVADTGNEPTVDQEKSTQFQFWLNSECKARLQAVRPILTKRSLKLFDDIVAVGGQCSPGDNKAFNFETPQGMRSQILKLEAASVVKSVRDEDDNRRKTILVTSNGWLVEYARRKGLDTLFVNDDDANDIVS